VGGLAVHADRATYDALTAAARPGESGVHGAFTLSAAAAATVHAAVHNEARRRERREHAALLGLLAVCGAAGLVGLVAVLLALVNAAAALTAAAPGGIGVSVALHLKRRARGEG
jgi:hypothetical protein